MLFMSPSQPTPQLRWKYIRGAALFSLIASDHNPVKYAGAEPKAQKKFVTDDYIIYSPATVLLALSSLSLWASFFCPSLCFPCSFVRKCFFICFVWLRREMQVSRCSRWWERESSHSWCIARPIMSKRDKMKVWSVCHVPQPWEALWGKGNLKIFMWLCNCWWTWIDTFSPPSLGIYRPKSEIITVHSWHTLP